MKFMRALPLLVLFLLVACAPVTASLTPTDTQVPEPTQSLRSTSTSIPTPEPLPTYNLLVHSSRVDDIEDSRFEGNLLDRLEAIRRYDFSGNLVEEWVPSQPLTVNDAGDFVVSHDTSRVYFGGYENGDRDRSYIWEVNFDNQSSLQMFATEHRANYLAISPDGEIITHSGYVDGESFIHIIELGDPSSGSIPLALGYAPSWSPDGAKIAYNCWNDNTPENDPLRYRDICIIDVETGEVTNTTDTINYDEAWPEWSPDGRQIAFVKGNYGVPHDDEVYIMDSDGSNLRQLTDIEIGDASSVSWSPDGTKIAYRVLQSFANLDNLFSAYFRSALFTIGVTGNDPVQLSSGGYGDVNGYVGSFSWSPDSQWLAYEYYLDSSNGLSSILISPAGGGEYRVFLTDPNNEIEYLNPIWVD